MAMITFIEIKDKNGKPEVTLSAYENGNLLPPGTWMVCDIGEREGRLMTIEYMPKHWLEQIEKWHKFGEKL